MLLKLYLMDFFILYPSYGKKERMVGVIYEDQSSKMLVQDWIVIIGFRTAAEYLYTVKEKPENYQKFLSRYDPAVLVVDVPPPYAENWKFVRNLIRRKESKGRGFVLTTTNKSQLDKLAYTSDRLGIVSKPFDLDELAEEITKAYYNYRPDNLLIKDPPYIAGILEEALL